MVVRRMVNYRNNGYSTLRNTVFARLRTFRATDRRVRDVLADRVAGLGHLRACRPGLSGTQSLPHRLTSGAMTFGSKVGAASASGRLHGQERGTYEFEYIWADHPGTSTSS